MSELTMLLEDDDEFTFLSLELLDLAGFVSGSSVILFLRSLLTRGEFLSRSRSL